MWFLSCGYCLSLSVAELNGFPERLWIVGNTADSALAFPLIPQSVGEQWGPAAPSLQAADKGLIEFPNAKGLGCGISWHSVCPEEIENGFSAALSAEYALLC